MDWKRGKSFIFENFWVYVSYVHVDSNNRDKLDPKAKMCFLIGYGSDDFSYSF